MFDIFALYIDKTSNPRASLVTTQTFCKTGWSRGGPNMAILWFCVKLFAMMGLLWQFAADGWAQRYPEKVVRLIVPFSPGSGNDTIGRVFAAGLGEVFGQQVIVDNRAGAGGNLGAGIAAKAAPDGYTVLLIN